jgi:hypothetical protein
MVKNTAVNYWEQIEGIFRNKNIYELLKKRLMENKQNLAPKSRKTTLDMLNNIIDSFLVADPLVLNPSNPINFIGQAKKIVADLEKEFDNIMESIKCNEKKDIVVKDLVNNLKILFSTIFKYKKISILANKMSAHCYLMNSYKFTNIFEAIQGLNREENIEKKLTIIYKTLEVIFK